MLAQHQIIRPDADGFRRKDLIRLLIGQHAVLMDAALMQEGVFADDGLIQRRPLADDIIDRLAGAINLRRVQPGRGVEDIAPGTHGHDDLFQRRVPGPLTQAVDGAFNLRRAPLDACQGVGRSHTQVVVAVDGQLNACSLRNLPREYTQSVPASPQVSCSRRYPAG